MTKPAGWYPDPTRAQTQRYWDGSTWSDHVAPLAPQSSSTNTLVTLGWLGALFLPLVGFIIGIVVTDRSKEGPWIIGVSVLSGIFWGFLWISFVN